MTMSRDYLPDIALRRRCHVTISLILRCDDDVHRAGDSRCVTLGNCNCDVRDAAAAAVAVHQYFSSTLSSRPRCPFNSAMKTFLSTQLHLFIAFCFTVDFVITTFCCMYVLCSSCDKTCVMHLRSDLVHKFTTTSSTMMNCQVFGLSYAHIYKACGLMWSL